MALLLLAARALPGLVEAATVDHALRAGSTREAALVAEACADLSIPHATLGVRLSPGNVQDRARRARYAALSAWCERRGLAALATGHHLDDQIETLVMRLNRGSGLAGLAGVRPRGVVPGGVVPVLRPLLDWRHGELEAVVAAAGISIARDPSNDDRRFDRVRIRHALAQCDWLEAEGWARSAALLADAEGYLACRLEEAWAGRVVGDRNELRMAPGPSDFEAVELARRAIAALGGAAARSEIAVLVARLRRGENASLGGVLARSEGQCWLFAPEPPRRPG